MCSKCVQAVAASRKTQQRFWLAKSQRWPAPSLVKGTTKNIWLNLFGNRNISCGENLRLETFERQITPHGQCEPRPGPSQHRAQYVCMTWDRTAPQCVNNIWRSGSIPIDSQHTRIKPPKYPLRRMQDAHAGNTNIYQYMKWNVKQQTTVQKLYHMCMCVRAHLSIDNQAGK